MSLTVDSVSKKFGRFPALNGASFVAPQGGFVSLLGPSGSGKTTLLRILGGLEFADSGMVRFADTVRALAADSASVLVDVGPSGTLAGFIRMAGGARAKTLPVMNQFGRDMQTLERVVEGLR